MAANAQERIRLESNGVALAKVRRPEFLSLIRRQPKAALAHAVPAAAREQLPAAVVANLESRVSGRGDLEVLARTAPSSIAVLRRARFGETTYTAHVFGERENQRTTRNISLHGVALDGHLAVSGSPLRAFEPGESIPAEKPVAADSCIVSGFAPKAGAVAAESGDRIYWLCRGGHLEAAEGMVAESEGEPITAAAYAQNGPRRVLLMLVDFSDRAGGPAGVAQTTLDEVATFLSECSYGQLTFPTRVVTSVLRMPQPSTYYRDRIRGDDELLNHARAAAVTAGFSPETFDFDAVAFEYIGMHDGSGNVWSGLGFVGTKGAWAQGPLSAATLAHEFGHNLGLWHANSWISSTTIGLGGTHSEYGNSFDAMGYAVEFPRKHYSANFKYVLGWLPGESVENVVASGTYRIYAQDQNSLLPERKYAVRIPVGIFVSGELEDYWLDFRQLLAARFPSTAAAPILQWGNDAGSYLASRLLDTLPATATMDDAPLLSGRVFTDNERSISIETAGNGGAGADAYVDVQISMTAPPFVELGAAMDLADATWTSSAVAWSGQRSITHDGVDAGASGPIGHSSESWAQTTVTGPGAISFWWKVSSEQGFDFLRVLKDDVLAASISGDVNWQFRSIEVPAGTHRIRWSYRKDSGVSSGADRGWVDEVRFDGTDRPPQITVEPAPFAGIEGEEAIFRVEVSGSEPMTFQWRHGAENIPSTTGPLLMLPNLRLEDAGEYSVVVNNAFGTATSAGAQLTVVRPIPLGEALDLNRSWSSLGERTWRGQSAVTFDGIDAARSGPVLDGQRSILQTTFIGPGTVTFWRKVSSEANFDLLYITLDGDIVEYFSGEIDWAQNSVRIPNGAHTVRWSYVKDSVGSAGQDAAWVDNVRFAKLENLEPAIVANPTQQTVGGNAMAVFTATLEGSTPLLYEWMKDGSPVQPREGIVGLDSPTLFIANPQPTDMGTYALRVSNDLNTAQSSGAILQSSGNAMSLAEAVDLPLRPWMSGGNSPWTVSGDYARTGAIGDLSQTWIETIVQGPARVSFRWRVSSEANFDYLTLVIDGADQMEIAGEVDWRAESVELPFGEHRVKWRYRKDWNTIGGTDSAGLDNVVITPLEEPRVESVALADSAISLDLTGLLFPGSYIIETSTDLAAWSPARTNHILAPTATISRPAGGAAEYIRIRAQ